MSVAETESIERLRDWRRFVIWRYDGKKKAPIDPKTGREANCHNPGIWVDYETARRAKFKVQAAVGVGFVLDDTPFCLVDLDNCIPGEEVISFAEDVLGKLLGVVEVSVSGTGMHVLIQGERPGERCTRKKPRQEIEIYDRGLVAIADEGIVDKPVPERQSELEALYWSIWPQQSIEDEAAEEPPCSTLEDAEVLELARNNRSTGNAFRKLYDHGDSTGYPSRSEAHFDLCRMLAYWTGKESGRIERLFRESALYATVERRNPQKYLRRTVERAVESLPRSYTLGLHPSDKEKVRRLAREHQNWIADQDWSYRGGETDRKVYEQLTQHAGEWGYLADDGSLEFNANQQAIADAVSVGQWTVSNSLKRLRERGLLTRTAKGHTGSNSYYKLDLFHFSGSSNYSETTTMLTPCVDHSSGEANTWMPIHSSGEAAVEGEWEPQPEENPEPDCLPEIEDAPEIDEDGWETIG